MEERKPVSTEARKVRSNAEVLEGMGAAEEAASKLEGLAATTKWEFTVDAARSIREIGIETGSEDGDTMLVFIPESEATAMLRFDYDEDFCWIRSIHYNLDGSFDVFEDEEEDEMEKYFNATTVAEKFGL